MITINSAIYTEEKIDELWNDLMSSKDIVIKAFNKKYGKYSQYDDNKYKIDELNLIEYAGLYQNRYQLSDSFIYTYSFENYQIEENSANRLLLTLFIQTLRYSETIDFFKYLIDYNFVPTNWLMNQILIICLFDYHLPKEHLTNYMETPSLKKEAIAYIAQTYLYLYWNNLPVEITSELIRLNIITDDLISNWESCPNYAPQCAYIFNVLHAANLSNISNYLESSIVSINIYKCINIDYLFLKLISITDKKCRDWLYEIFYNRYNLYKPFKHLIKKYSNICKSLKDKLPEPLDKEELEFNADVY